MPTATYRVSGMTCGHCVKAVADELTKLATVTSVDVALEAGRVTLTSTVALDEDDVRAAVEEAGYELVGVSDPGRKA